MTNTQFQILDELYFVTPFSSLVNTLGINQAKLENELGELWKKGWIKVLYPDPDTEVLPQALNQDFSLPSCYFLATKAGLLAHNTL